MAEERLDCNREIPGRRQRLYRVVALRECDAGLRFGRVDLHACPRCDAAGKAL